MVEQETDTQSPNLRNAATSVAVSRVWRARSYANSNETLNSSHSDLERSQNSKLEASADAPASDRLFAAGVPQPIREVLFHRGITSDEKIASWFRPSLKSLREPSVLKDMDKAIERLLIARRKQEAILLYADYDLDGTSGLALALRAFELMGFTNVSGYQPQRLTEGYGLHSSAIQKLHQDRGVQLLVSIDLGITAMEEAAFARTLGIDVIITDHHLPKVDDAGVAILPEAVAVVNPNRGNCESQLGHLCGTGVIFYLVLALRRALMEQGLLQEAQDGQEAQEAQAAFDPKILLDCFAIGTITDLVPLQEENRILVKHGLVKLASTDRPGLSELLKALNLWGRPLTAQDVAIRFAPKLNALSRMGSGIQPIDLYLEKDIEKARAVVAAVLANNQDRQVSQKAADEEAEAVLSRTPPKGVIAIASDKFHRGVVGLVATKLSQRYGIPAFIGAIEGESGAIIGSARLPNGLSANLLHGMTAAAEYLDQFGGHAVAAGFEAKRESFDSFRRSLEKWAEGLGADPQLGDQVVEYDAHCSLSELTPGFMGWCEHMGPFGAQAPIPLFMFKECLVTQVKLLNGGHLRLRLSQLGAPPAQAIWFSPPALQGLSEHGQLLGRHVDVIAEVQWNHFQGVRTIQLLVSDLKIASSGVATRQKA